MIKKLIIIFIFIFPINSYSKILNNGEIFSDEVEIDGLYFFLPGKNYKLELQSLTNVTYNYSFSEYFFTKKYNGKIVSAVRIFYSIPGDRDNFVSYIGHDEICNVKNRFLLKKKKSGFSFNCWGIYVDFLKNHSKISEIIYSNNYGASKSTLDASIDNFYKNIKNSNDLVFKSHHSAFSKLYKNRHYSIEYIFLPSFFADLKIYNDNLLTNMALKNILNLEQQEMFEKTIFFFNNLQYNFENTMKLNNNLKILNNNNAKQKSSLEIYEKKDIVNMLKELEEMFNSGHLNKKQFEKAKNQVLNNN